MQTSGDRRREKVESYSRRMGRAKRNPSPTNARVDGYRFAPPILRDWMSGEVAKGYLERAKPPAEAQGLPTKQAGSPSGQNVAFCDAANRPHGPLLTGNGNSVRFSVMVQLAYKLRSRLVALCKNNREESCAN
jgi:hypothetical protein